MGYLPFPYTQGTTMQLSNLNEAQRITLTAYMDHWVTILRRMGFNKANAEVLVHPAANVSGMYYIDASVHVNAPSYQTEREMKLHHITYDNCPRCGLLRAGLEAEPLRPRWFDPGPSMTSVLLQPALILGNLKAMHNNIVGDDWAPSLNQVTAIFNQGQNPGQERD